MTDQFDDFIKTLTSPAGRVFAISPDDDNDLSLVTRGLWVGGAGDVVVVADDDPTDEGTTFTCPAGAVLPVRVRKVLESGTDATNIVGLL